MFLGGCYTETMNAIDQEIYILYIEIITNIILLTQLKGP